MTDCFVGEIRLFGGPYAPVGWQLCNGALLSIQSYPALYSLIGTTYGGDGQTTFAIPDFRGRLAVGQGQTAPPSGSTSSNFILGQSGGTETVSLTAAQNGPHTHTFNAVNIPATTTMPSGNMLAAVTPNGNTMGLYIDPTKPGTAQVADPNFVDFAGGAASGGSSRSAGNPHDNMMPFQAINYIICLEGLYPDRP